MKQYVLIEEARTPGKDPWGIWGVFPKDVVDVAKRDDEGVLRLDSSTIIVGDGPGWDNSSIFDMDWLREAARRMEGWEK